MKSAAAPAMSSDDGPREAILPAGPGPEAIPVRVLQWGEASIDRYGTHRRSETFVFLHGLGDGADVWRPTIAAWPTGTHLRSSVAIDFPGHGGSGPLSAEHYQVEKLAMTVSASLEQLGITRPILIGHSLGARVALALAAGGSLRPRATVLIDMSPEGDGAIDDAICAYIDAVIGGASSRDRLTDVITARLPLADASAAREVVAAMARARTDGVWHLPLDPAIKTLLAGGDNEAKAWALLRSLHGRVGIIRGAYSSVLHQDTARRMAAATRYPARLETIAMAGHAIPFEQPGALAAALALMVNDLTPAM